jgi:hypothetical protein
MKVVKIEREREREKKISKSAEEIPYTVQNK